MIWLVSVFFVFLIINRITSTYLANKQFYDYLDNHLLDSASYTRAIFYKYDEALPLLISYWSEHSGEMDIPRDGAPDVDYFNELVKGKDIFSYDSKDLQALSDEDKKKYAETCYLMIANEFDNLANTYGDMSFFCTREFDDSTSEMILFLGMIEGNTNPYMLGTLYEVESMEREIQSEVNMDDSDAATYYITASTEVIPETLDNIMNDYNPGSDREAYSYYVLTLPIYDINEKIIATVSVGYDRQIVNKEIKHYIRISDLNIIIRMTLICIIVILLMRKNVIKPLEIVSDAVCDYIRTKNSSDVKNDLDAMINTSRKTEIDSLAENIYDMSLEIDEYTEEIRITSAEIEKKKTEMDMAKTIQKGQLPLVTDVFKDRKEFSLFASMTPARDVGGDFYDFFMLYEDHLVLVIADVSGKGIPAALFMMTSKALIRSELKGEKSLESTFKHVNDQLNDTNAANMFVTVWVAVIELSTGVVRSINAGHENPAIKKDGERWEFEELPHDIPVACMSNFDYKENKWDIKLGDYIFVYTDGVLDASNEEDERFGTTRMIEALNNCRKENPKEIIQEIESKIVEFEGDADIFDDTTMLCFLYKKYSSGKVSYR